MPRYVGFELWTVNSGSVFDNVLVTDDKAYATKMAAETWGKIKEGEKDAQEVGCLSFYPFTSLSRDPLSWPLCEN